MTKPEVIEKQPMNVVEVKSALEKIRKTEEELNFRAQKTEEYAQELAKLKPAQAKELLKKMQELEIPRVKDVHMHKLIDLLPTSDKQVKMILTSYHLTVSAENVKKIAKVLDEYTEK